MNKFSDVELCIGPMSKNIVDSIISFVNKTNNKILLIPSRRQIEYNGGYVNNWTTSEFCSYVRKRTNNIYLERDHGGPGQGTFMDDGLESLKYDCEHFDIIHVDVWKKYQKYEDGLKYTIELINYCYDLNNNLYFEIATEEAIRQFTVGELKIFMNDLKKILDKKVYERIVYLVIQSGTALKEGVNTGMYDNKRLKDMIKLSQEFNILTKEHNGDWISDNEIKDKFNHGLSALNIAPEFGMIETKVILQEIDNLANSEEYFETFFKVCYESKNWVKWVNDNFDPFKNKRKLIEICGHYVFTNKDIMDIKMNIPNIDEKIRQTIYKRLEHLYLQLRRKNILTNENTMEDIFTIKDFPVSMSVVPLKFMNYKYLDMTYQVCKKTGIIQIKNYPSLDDMYITPHNTSFGKVWKDLFELFSSKINKIINKYKFKNILEIGGGTLLLADIILKNKDINKYIVYEKNLYKKHTNDNRIELHEEYYTENTKFINNIDIIIHSHVLEHVLNPNNFINLIQKNIEDGKYHCFIIPNLKQTFTKKYANSLNFEHNVYIEERYVDIILYNNKFDIIEKSYYLDHSILYITKYNQNKNNITKKFPNLFNENKQLVISFKKYYEEIIKKINLQINNLEGELYLFGGHIFSQYLIKFGLDIKNIINILDNSKEKENCKLYGTELIIKNPTIIKDKKNVTVIIKAASYQTEIEEQLLKINKNVKIIN